MMTTIAPDDLARLARYYSPRELAGILGITASSVRKRLNRLGLHRSLRVRHLRPCLCCGHDFAPEHRHNRLCPGCVEGTPDYEVRA